ncbi:tetratricopeptide repeat protein [Clostridium zeae]|nr:tetratricopeptide repeat protein [Clostridium zeae]
MTRAFISMMESGKRSISKASSKKLVEKFIDIAKRIHVNLELDDEYFSRFPEEDARYYCENEIKNGQALSHKDLEELIEIEKSFHLDDLLAETYRKNGLLYFNEKEYFQAFSNLHSALGKYKEIRSYVPQIEILCYLGNCKLRSNQFEDSIFFYKQAVAYAEEFGVQNNYFIASQSLATVYGQMKKYDECLAVLDNNIINHKVKADQLVLVNAKLMKATVLLYTNKDHEAGKAFFEIIPEVRTCDPSLLGLIYNNIAEYYYKVENYEKALLYISEAQKHKLATNKEFLSSTLALKGKILLAQGMREESILLHELAIDLADQYRRFDMLVDNYKNLVKILEENKEFKRIEQKMEYMITTLEENNVEDGIQYALYKLMEIATVQNDSDKALKLLHRLEHFL